MGDIIRLLVGAISQLFRSRRSLLLENLALRQQLAVLKRKHPRPRLVEQTEPWPRMPTFQNRELLPEREVLEGEIPAATKEATERSESEQKPREHGPELYQIKAADVAVSY